MSNHTENIFKCDDDINIKEEEEEEDNNLPFKKYEYSSIPQEIQNINNNLINNNELPLFINSLNMNNLINYRNKFVHEGKNIEFINYDINKLLNYYNNEQVEKELKIIINCISCDNYLNFDNKINKIIDIKKACGFNDIDNIKKEILVICYNEILNNIFTLHTTKPIIIDNLISFLKHIYDYLNIKYNIILKFNNEFIIENIINKIKENYNDNEDIIDKYDIKMCNIIYFIIKLIDFNMINEYQINNFINNVILNIFELVNKYDFINNIFNKHILYFLYGYNVEKLDIYIEKKANYNYNIHNEIIQPLVFNHKKFNDFKSNLNNNYLNYPNNRWKQYLNEYLNK